MSTEHMSEDIFVPRYLSGPAPMMYYSSMTSEAPGQSESVLKLLIQRAAKEVHEHQEVRNSLDHGAVATSPWSEAHQGQRFSGAVQKICGILSAYEHQRARLSANLEEYRLNHTGETGYAAERKANDTLANDLNILRKNLLGELMDMNVNTRTAEELANAFVRAGIRAVK
ncbi:MAG: hypothetical protein Q8P16_02675 [bacterium]|nr:hypothetical protein [bacterium]